MTGRGTTRERTIDIGPFVLFLVFILLGIFYVSFRIQSIELLYRISEARQENRDLKRTQEQLLLEVAVLKSPSRIVDIATRELDMVRPSIDQVVIIR